MSYQDEAGKGDKRRPADVSADKYRANWDTIFKKDVFNKNKVENFKQSTRLEQLFCATCKDMGGEWDCGWYYECTSCGK